MSYGIAPVNNQLVYTGTSITTTVPIISPPLTASSYSALPNGINIGDIALLPQLRYKIFSTDGSDIAGPSYYRVSWTGSRWEVLRGDCVFSISAYDYTSVGTATLNTFVTSIPAGLVGVNEMWVISEQLECTGGSGASTFNLSIAGSGSAGISISGVGGYRQDYKIYREGTNVRGTSLGSGSAAFDTKAWNLGSTQTMQAQFTPGAAANTYKFRDFSLRRLV